MKELLWEMASSPFFFWDYVYQVRGDKKLWPLIHDCEAMEAAWCDSTWKPWELIKSELGEEFLPMYDSTRAIRILAMGGELKALSNRKARIKYSVTSQTADLYDQWRADVQSISFETDELKRDLSYARKYINKTESRICGLWLFDHVDILRSYKTVQDAVTNLQCLKIGKRKIVDILGYGETEYKNFHRMYANAKKCIEGQKIIQMR